MEVNPPVEDLWPVGRVAADNYDPGEEAECNMFD
jgi:hypothetical protein